jgi:hypothetical protein
MRTTRTLSPTSLRPTQWVTLPSASKNSIVQTPARWGTRFKLFLDGNVTSLEPPHGGVSGQSIVWRFQQDPTGGRTVARNAAGFAVRGDLPAVSSAANSVTFWEGLYDDESGLWELRGVPDLSDVYLAQTSRQRGTATTDASGLISVTFGTAFAAPPIVVVTPLCTVAPFAPFVYNHHTVTSSGFTGGVVDWDTDPVGAGETVYWIAEEA